MKYAIKNVRGTVVCVAKMANGNEVQKWTYDPLTNALEGISRTPRGYAEYEDEDSRAMMEKVKFFTNLHSRYEDESYNTRDVNDAKFFSFVELWYNVGVNIVDRFSFYDFRYRPNINRIFSFKPNKKNIQLLKGNNKSVVDIVIENNYDCVLADITDCNVRDCLTKLYDYNEKLAMYARARYFKDQWNSFNSPFCGIVSSVYDVIEKINDRYPNEPLDYSFESNNNNFVATMSKARQYYIDKLDALDSAEWVNFFNGYNREDITMDGLTFHTLQTYKEYKDAGNYWHNCIGRWAINNTKDSNGNYVVVEVSNDLGEKKFVFGYTRAERRLSYCVYDRNCEVSREDRAYCVKFVEQFCNEGFC